MFDASTRFRNFLILGICSVLAIFLGYIVASPFDWTALAVYAGITLLFALPFLLRWHYPLLIASWNMNAVMFLMPGRPPLWLLMIAMSLMFSAVNSTLNKKGKFSSAPQVIYSLLFLAAVVLATAQLRGGIGLGSLGAQVAGGRRYIYLFGAILGYFALTYHQIAQEKAYAYGTAFFLGGITPAIGSLLPLVNPAFYIIFAIFPPEQSGLETLGLVQEGAVFRLSGLSFASVAIFCTLMACYGIKGIFNISGQLNFLPFRFQGGFQLNQPWRLLLFVGNLVMSLFGGFRSILLILLLTFVIQFLYEKLHRTSLLPKLLFVLALSAALILPFASKLPLSVQRTLSVLPIDVDPVAKQSAKVSTDWRLNIWQRVLPKVPQYLFLGKGYAISSAELELLGNESLRGQDTSQDTAILAGDYHNGPLSVIIPFGIFGALGFLWFLFASFSALRKNYRYGAPSLRNINRFLLAYFITRTIFFFVVYGSLYNDFIYFVGIVGLSVSLNGGVKTKNSAQDQLEAGEQAVA